MKVVLVNPPMVILNNCIDRVELYPPLGLGYVASVLEKQGHEVEILDAVILNPNNYQKFYDRTYYLGVSFEDLAGKVKDVNPEIVGITGLNFWKKSIFSTAEKIKGAKPNLPIIVGGPFATTNPIECLSQANIDFVIIGEGEITTVELLEVLSNKMYDKISEIEGVGYKVDDKIRINKPRPYIVDLDSIPFPARYLMSMEKYFKAYQDPRFSRGLAVSSKVASIITSRGCPFNCIFCSANILAGKKWRHRSAENVVREIEELVKKYDVKQIYFEDENISLSKNRMEKICDLIIDKNVDIKIRSMQGIRADTLNENILRKMKQAGYEEITLAPESGVQRVVDEIIDKKMTLRKIEEVVKICKKLKIKVSCFFVIGMPGETKEEIRKTLLYARKLRKLGVEDCFVRNALPIVGTRLYGEAKEKGYLIKDGDELENSLLFNNEKHMLRTPEWDPEDIEKYVQIGIKENMHDLFIKSILNIGYMEKFLQGMVKHPIVTSKFVWKKLKPILS